MEFLAVEPYLSYMMAMTKPLRDLNIRTVYELAFTAEVSSSETYLNEKYGLPYNANTRDADFAAGSIIYIETYDDIINRTYIFNAAENQPPVYLYNTAENQPARYLFNTIEYLGQYDAIIWVPATLQFNLNTLTAQVNKLRAYGKNFQIITY